MADEDDVRNQEQGQQEDSRTESGGKKTSVERLQWIIMAAVVVVGAATGFGLGRLFGSSSTIQTDQSAKGGPNHVMDLKEDTPDATGAKSKETWYYDLEPVVANLDSPGVTRYVRVTLTLEIDSQINVKRCIALIEEKKPLLTNWLTIYLAGLTLEDIRGDKNLKRIQLEIVDALNEKLFPDTKPQIKSVLFKEFAIQ